MEDPVLLSYILFISFSVVSGAVIQWGVSKIKFAPPVSILWLLYGALLCCIEIATCKTHRVHGRGSRAVDNVLDDSRAGLFSLGLAEASRLPHNALYFVLLPILLYDATQQVDWFYFRKNLRNGCALAITGIFLQVAVIGFLMKLVAGQLNLSLDAWLMLSAGIGATDPIAVLSVLEHMDAPKQFSSLFDCESLINDGSAVFMFQFFKSLARGGSFGLKESAVEFCQLTLLAPVVGLCSALILYRCVRHFRFHVYDVTLLILGVSYLVFFVSEIYVHTSGPIAIVVFGLYFRAYGRAGLNFEAEQTHKIFVKGLGVGATSLVFIITGITCVRIFWDTFDGANNLVIADSNPVPPGPDANVLAPILSTVLLWYLPLFYLVCHVARAAMVIVFTPLIRRDLGSFGWREGMLLWWGGLRGGVCLIIALLIEQDETLSQKIRSLAALYLAATTVLILLINGTTFQYLYNYLQPYELNPFKAIYLNKILKFIDAEFEEEARLLHDHWLFANTKILVISKSLVPRLTSIKVSSAYGVNFPTVSVSEALRGVSLAKCVLPTANGSDISHSSGHTEIIVRTSSPDASVCSAHAGLIVSPTSSIEPSSSRISLTGQNITRRVQHLSNFRIDWKGEHSPTAELFNDDLQRPLLPTRELIAASVKQPLYRVAAYSGGYTYRNRQEGYLKDGNNGDIAKWPVRKALSEASEGSAKTPESSWSTHFLGPTHCGTIAAPDHNVLSPKAANKIKNVLTWERESEVSVMVMNSARHLYRRMYEQSFISGNNYMHFMAVGDLVNDFAVSRGKPGKQKQWHRLIANECIVEKRLADPAEKLPPTDLLKITPFDLEWMLVCRQLHMCSNWELPVYKSIQRRRLWSSCLRRLLLRWWRIIGSRQTFPALDDLQEICAYVDVHEEMLLRGNPGLKFVLGQHLLESYVCRARMSQSGVIRVLQEVYPESFKYALICHGAIFLINLKIQLVEEYYERGLLMASDSEIILNTLKRQLVRIMKFHPVV